MDGIGTYVKWSKPGSERQRPHVFYYMGKTDTKDEHTHTKTWSYTHLYVEHICSSGFILWNSRDERMEKRMIVNNI
jgi:hypothetical protein